MSKIVFLDTNVYLHYQPFDQIDWLELLKTDALTIVVPPVTIRELNKRKDLPSRPRVGKRAGQVLKRLLQLHESGPEPPLREGVVLRFEDREPNVDFAAHQLVQEAQDDVLIASIIMCQDEHPDADIVLVTSDLGLTLLIKAGRQGIATAQLPDSLKLPEEADERDKQIKQLQQELLESKKRTPELALTFRDGAEHAEFVLQPPAELTEGEVDDALEKVKLSYPKLEEAAEPPRELGPLIQAIQAASATKLDMNVVPPEAIQKYNAQLEEYYQRFAQYLESEAAYRNSRRRTIVAGTALTNSGTAPADDIDVWMGFPDGLRVATQDQLRGAPEPPEPPPKPRSPWEQLLRHTPSPMDFMPPSLEHYLSDLPSALGVSDTNVSTPTIRRTNSYEVEFHIDRVKHNTGESCPTLYLVLDSFEHADPFHSDYRIRAGNVPHEINGQLHFVIRKD